MSAHGFYEEGKEVGRESERDRIAASVRPEWAVALDVALNHREPTPAELATLRELRDWLVSQGPAEARAEMLAPRRECVACGRPCRPGQRWCSLGCFYLEDGPPESAYDDNYDEYPDDDEDES